MIDITTITESLEPIMVIDITTPKPNYKSTRAIWIMIITIVAIFGIWGYIVYSEKKKISDSFSDN